MAYFDNNATTPVLPNVVEAFILASKENWANPSSPHRSGGRVRVLIERARQEFAQSFDVKPNQLTFTSGATESNNTVMYWLANRTPEIVQDILISSIEHPSVSESAQSYFAKKIRLIPVNSQGVVEIEDFKKLVDEKCPSFVSLMAAHNETGVIQPWKQVAQICKDRRIWFHCDATQWVGKLNHSELNICSSFSFSAHKFGGLKGVGGIVSQEPLSFMKGGGQEMETRGGTENFPGIEGMRVAWNSQCNLNKSIVVLEDWKKNFEDCLFKEIPNLKVIGHSVPRLWNTTLLCLPEFDNLSWVSKLDKLGYMVSTGSACSTARDQPSSLAGSIGLSEIESRRLVRVSSYTYTNEKDWVGLADAFKNAYKELRSERENTGVITL